MKTKIEKNCAYLIDGKKAVFVDFIDGINLFKLEVDERLMFFYYIDKINYDVINIFDKKKIEILRENEIPENFEKADCEKIKIDEDAFYKFVFMLKPEVPNAAFCPKDMLENLFERKGIIYDETQNIEVGKKFRAVNPAYCLFNNFDIYRQTDMREDYPELVLKFEKFDKKFFLETSKLQSNAEIYLSAKSAAEFGGNHKEYSEWKKKVCGEYAVFFKGFTMAEFKRIFVIKNEKKLFFEKINLNENDIMLIRNKQKIK